jgi:hypothetical protein
MGIHAQSVKNIIYVPGFTHILLYVSQFAQNKNTAEIVKNFIYLNLIDRPVTCPFFSATRVALNTTIAKNKAYKIIRHKIGNLRHVPLETLHHLFGHRRSDTIMFASYNIVWSDTIAMMAPESFCDPCNILIIINNNRNKFPSTGPQTPRSYPINLLPIPAHYGLQDHGLQDLEKVSSHWTSLLYF